MSSRLSEWEGLARAAEALAKGGEGAERARLDAADELLWLGLAAESWPEMGEEALAALGAPERAALGQLIDDSFRADFAVLENALEEAERAPADFEAPSALAEDPPAASARQAAMAEGLMARERLSRLDWAWRSHARQEHPQRAALDGLDARLRALLPRLRALAPARARLADEVPEEAWESHWWLTEPAPEAAEEQAPRDARAFAEWVARRVERAGGGDVLRLDREEARALLATRRGQALAEQLGDQLDLGAAAFDDDEIERALAGRSVGQVLAAGHHAGEAPPSAGEVVDLAARRAAKTWSERRKGTPAAAAATASPGLATEGARALALFDVASAVLEPGLGVVALGSRATDFVPVWLVIPSLGIRALRFAELEIQSERWQGGGLQLRAEDERELILEAVDAEGGRSRHRLTCAGAPDEEDPLTEALAGCASGDRQAVLAALAALERGDEERRALSGLRAAVEAWPG